MIIMIKFTETIQKINLQWISNDETLKAANCHIQNNRLLPFYFPQKNNNR